MKKIREEVNKKNMVRFIDWLIYMFGYTLVFILASFLFKSFYIDTSSFCIYPFIAVIIIYILNKTIKPVLVTLTIPITGLTLGLFYLLINLFILKLTDWILMSHFNIGNTIYAFFIAIAISIMNVLMEGLIIKPIIRRFKKNE